MNDTNTKDYMIDVAQDTTYQNQSDDYKKSFAKWRSNPQNSFGFQFTHDTREHSYIDGEGFVPHKAEVAERISMLKCCSLLGICLVVMLAIDFLNYFIVNKYAPDTTGTFVYFSQTGWRIWQIWCWNDFYFRSVVCRKVCCAWSYF